jgi:iron complex transport system substrate-binding protein
MPSKRNRKTEREHSPALNPDLRIACFLPAAAEMACALGLLDNLVGISHECDFPPEVKNKPVVVRCAVDLSSLKLDQIDKAVRERVGLGGSVYAVDEAVLREISPNLIVTQDLCQVCAPSGNEATQVMRSLSPKPEILWQTSHTFEEVLQDLLFLGEKTGTQPKAEELKKRALEKVEAISQKSAKLPPVQVFFMEWVDPIYCGGHWVPELIRWAGGLDPLSKPAVDSVRIPWEKILELNPEVLIIAPCGYGTKAAQTQAALLKTRPGYENLAAVQKNQVWAVDANSYFARPGLRLVTGLEILAHLFHPEIFSWEGPSDAFLRV